MRSMLFSTHIGTILYIFAPISDDRFRFFDQVNIIAGRGEYRLFLTCSRPIKMQYFSDKSMGVVECTIYLLLLGAVDVVYSRHPL